MPVSGHTLIKHVPLVTSSVFTIIFNKACVKVYVFIKWEAWLKRNASLSFVNYYRFFITFCHIELNVSFIGSCDHCGVSFIKQGIPTILSMYAYHDSEKSQAPTKYVPV